ncbi:unnamed protein product [Closterium sp. NIES-53]
MNIQHMLTQRGKSSGAASTLTTVKTHGVRRQRKVKNEPCAERRVQAKASGVTVSGSATPPPPDDVVSHLRNPTYQRDFQALALYGPHGVGCQLTAQDALTLADGECLADTVVDFYNIVHADGAMCLLVCVRVLTFRLALGVCAIWQPEEIPTQSNSVDRGIYVCMYLHALVSSGLAIIKRWVTFYGKKSHTYRWQLQEEVSLHTTGDLVVRLFGEGVEVTLQPPTQLGEFGALVFPKEDEVRTDLARQSGMVTRMELGGYVVCAALTSLARACGISEEQLLNGAAHELQTYGTPLRLQKKKNVPVRQLQQLRMGNQQRSVEDRPSNDDIVISLKNQSTSTNWSPRKKSVALKQLKRELEVNMKLRRPQTSSTDASATSETSTVSTPSMNSTTSSRTTLSTTTKNHGNRERQDRPSATPGENTELWEMPFDPINETINGYNEQRQPILLEVICNGRRLQALMDSGASHSVCDKATLERINEKYTPSNFTAMMVDGSKLQVYGEAALHLQMGPLRWKPTLSVTNIKRLDLILGRDFLKKFNPEINWVTLTASIYDQDRRVPLPNWSNTGDIPEETLACFEKDVKQTMAGFVALVTNEDEGERKTLELPPAIQKLLEEFEDVLLDDLPDQLPPYRTHQHEIIEEPASSRWTGVSWCPHGRKWGVKMVCGPGTGQQIRLGAYNMEDDAAYAYATAAYVIRHKDHIPHMKVLTDTEMAALDGCVRLDVRHLVKARMWWRWRQWRTAVAEVGIAPGTPFPLENGGSRSPPISIGDDKGEYPLTPKDDAANEEMQEPELG